MPRIAPHRFREKQALFKELEEDFTYVQGHFRELAEYIIPRRYRTLYEGRRTNDKSRSSKIADSFGTQAARTLASGMLAGVTSPTRPWFHMSIPGESDDLRVDAWTDDVQKKMLRQIAGTNLYNALAVCYLDLCIFGTSVMLIYEDDESMFRCYNPPAGEYRLGLNARQEVSILGRRYEMTVLQMVEQFGLSNLSDQTKQLYKNEQGGMLKRIPVYHLIEPNRPGEGSMPRHFEYREYYWEDQRGDGQLLAMNGFRERPFIAPRWEVVGNEIYGVSPGMDALTDIISLQHLVRRKAQALDKLVSPPVIADMAIQHNPAALVPNGITYVPNSSAVGVKPIYTVNPPLQDITQDILALKQHIATTFYNDLFRTVSQLTTVRSATEIQERVEEKLVLLGPTLNRFENEALEGIVHRVFQVMYRRGAFEPFPSDSGELKIEYRSVLSDAQHAVGIGSIERFMAAIGSIVGIAPDAGHVVDFNMLLREYGDRLNIPAKTLKSQEEVEARLAQERALVAAQQEALVGETLTSAAKNLSQATPNG